LGGNFASNTCTLQSPITGHIIISSINGFTLDCVENFINAQLSGQGVGILVEFSSEVTILNCEVSEFNDNILVNNSEKNRIVGNTLIAAQTNGILLLNSHENEVDSNDGSGNDFLVTLRNSNDNIVSSNIMDLNQNVMAMDNSNGNRIQDNSMTNNDNMGFEVFASTNNIISGNSIIGNNDFGLKLTNSPGNEITDNEITFNNGNGLVLIGSDGNTIADNQIQSNLGDGIQLLNSDENQIMRNLIDANLPNFDIGSPGNGLFIDSSQSNTISENNITNNQENGVALFSSSDNIIVNNNFVGNSNHLLDDSVVDNKFNLPLPVGGNHYDPFDGAVCEDADDNDICDDPFFFSVGQDDLPWSKPNGWLNPPTTAEEKIEGLITEVDKLELNDGNKNALTKKLVNAINNITNEDPSDDSEACEKLQAFINQLNAKVKSDKLDASDVEDMIDVAEGLIDELCSDS